MENSSKASKESLMTRLYVEGTDGAEITGKQSSALTRMAVLEARADKRASIKILLLLPVMFLIFGLTLG